jgi:hypothetical protein
VRNNCFQKTAWNVLLEFNFFAALALVVDFFPPVPLQNQAKARGVLEVFLLLWRRHGSNFPADSAGFNGAGPPFAIRPMRRAAFSKLLWRMASDKLISPSAA